MSATIASLFYTELYWRLAVGSDYERVRDAIAETMFGSDLAGRPVYTLADADILRQILQAAGVDEDEAALANVVRSTLFLDDPGIAPFRGQADASERHRQNPLETPYSLPLLLLLTTAAEKMQADGDLAANNYYSRLHRLLKVPTHSYARVESDYRRHAVQLWGSLNVWLEAWEGERGIPTAYSVGGHAYIGLPMSQAVVRQHDRAGLHELFALEGMTPGLRIAPTDMSSAMDPYATATPSPMSSHLLRLWRIPAARERIVDAACLELETWDGSGQDIAVSNRVASTRLLAFLRTFPRKSIEFNLMLPYQSEGPEVAKFFLGSESTDVPTVAGPGGSTRLSGVQGISSASLVGEQLEGTLGDNESRSFGRRPKRVTPLRWDDLQGAFVEVEQISLGEDSIVLAREDARQRVESHLGTHARPGWHELPDLNGVPSGWLVYEHVQVISAPVSQTHFDLLPLIPRVRTSLTLRGGFVLPGLLRKWSSLDPPEVIALAAGASSLAVRVYAGTHIDAEQVVAQTDGVGELVVLPLADRHLVDGEYVVAMFVDGSNRPSSTALLRLRSADTPQFRVEDLDIRLVYSPESSPLWVLSAGPASWMTYVNGARTVGLAENADEDAPVMREYVSRKAPALASHQVRARVGVPMADDSCLVTGMHRFLLPPVLPDQPRTRSVDGECVTCGLVRRFAGTPWAARRRENSETNASRSIEIPPVVDFGEPNFEVAFDALNHVGRGSYATLERITAQVEGSGVFADSFLRRQEVVGHIDIARTDRLQVSEWAVNSATLVPIGDQRWVLIGSRSSNLLAQLRHMVEGIGEVVESVDAELARVEVVGALPGSELARVGIEVLVESPALPIARALPPLNKIALALKRVVVPKYRSVEFWDTNSASWDVAESMMSVGAYRLRDFTSTYAIRSAKDIDGGTMGLGNARLVKHIANLWAGDPLVGYDSKTGSVVVPLGADLPALYGRALSLCSGRSPREIVKQRILQYPSVPREVANAVFARVSQ